MDTGPTRYKYFIDKNFQTKYTGYLVFSSLISILLIGGPIYYILNQNYEIFQKLSYEFAPTLSPHLEVERNGLNGYLFFSLIMLVVFQTYFGLKMTFRIIGPIYALMSHLKSFINKSKYQPTLILRENDEFQDLVNTYNYAFLKIRTQNQKELEQLKTLTVNDPNSKKVLQDLVQNKQSFMAQNFIESDASPSPNHDSHLAS